LLLSYTRAAWISIFIIAVIFVIVKLRISWKLIGLGVFLAGTVFYFYRTDIFMKLERNQQDSSKDIAKHLESISNIRTDASNLERINRWNSAFRMFQERPVVGWGPGTYMFQYAPFQASREKTIISTNRGDWGNAHSEYIGPLAESGVLGCVIMIILVIASIWLGFRVYYAAEPYSQERIFSLALTLGLITYYIHGILNNFLDTDKASALVWGYTAMLVAMDIKQKRRGLSTTP
jgi:O-antigen ligase